MRLILFFINIDFSYVFFMQKKNNNKYKDTMRVTCIVTPWKSLLEFTYKSKSSLKTKKQGVFYENVHLWM